MPEAADEKHDQIVQNRAALALAAAAQRDVEIVAEPRRERDVPAVPEVPHRGREERLAKVLHQRHAHDLRRADGDVGVAAEVAVDLEREQHARERHGAAGLSGGSIEHGIHEERQPVGDDHLDEQAPRHAREPCADALSVKALVGAQLPEQRAGALDGAGDELREERDEQRVAEKIRLRVDVAAVDVDGVAQRLKRVERDADGQEQADRRHGEADARKSQHPREILEKERRVLEHRQHAEVGDQHGNERSLARKIPPRARDDAAAEPGHDRREQHQQSVFRRPAHIEIVAGGEQPIVPPAHGDDEVQQRHHRKKQ